MIKLLIGFALILLGIFVPNVIGKNVDMNQNGVYSFGNEDSVKCHKAFYGNPELPVKFYVKFDPSNAERSVETNYLMERIAAEWNKAVGHEVAVVVPDGQGTTPIYYADLGGSVLGRAFAVPFFIKPGWYASQIQLNDRLSSEHIYHTLLHEVGHILNLGHDPFIDGIMFPSMQRGYHMNRILKYHAMCIRKIHNLGKPKSYNYPKFIKREEPHGTRR